MAPTVPWHQLFQLSPDPGCLCQLPPCLGTPPRPHHKAENVAANVANPMFPALTRQVDRHRRPRIVVKRASGYLVASGRPHFQVATDHLDDICRLPHAFFDIKIGCRAPPQTKPTGFSIILAGRGRGLRLKTVKQSAAGCQPIAKPMNRKFLRSVCLLHGRRTCNYQRSDGQWSPWQQLNLGFGWMRVRFKLTVIAVLVCGRCFGADLAANRSAFLQDHCSDCHSGDAAEAGLAIDSLPLAADNPAGLRIWSKIRDRVESGEMPPADYGEIDAATRHMFIKTVDAALLEVDRQRRDQFGRRELRRLGRAEFANSLCDLLDLPHMPLEVMLPPDGSVDGLDKSSGALDFSHVMVGRYLETAEVALRAALAKSATPVPSKIVRSELKSVDGVSDTLQTLRVQLKQGIAIPLVGQTVDPTFVIERGDFTKQKAGGITDPPPHFDAVATFMHSRGNHDVTVKPFKVPQSGAYTIRVNGWAVRNDHGKLVPTQHTETVAFYTRQGELLGRCDLPPLQRSGGEPTTAEVTVWLEKDQPVEYLAVSCPDSWIQLPQKGDPIYTRIEGRGIALRWFEMEGPAETQWPPESHRGVLGDLPIEPAPKDHRGLPFVVQSDDPAADARRLIADFAHRAWRRPVDDSSLELPFALAMQRLDDGEPLAEAVLAGLRAVLVSPEFLLLDEPIGPLDDWALASRLSFFVWNSPPDEELRTLARRGELRDREVLDGQLDRLLGDPKVERFVAHYLDQWLSLANIRLTEPDVNLYPGANPLLTESMIQETRAYFAEMIRRDLGAEHVIDSDFLMINQRLAELYGIDDVWGSDIRRVAIPADHVRGGLLTQASILKITANGTTTSPVVRGAFVLNHLLGTPPPPPPPGVPAIDPDISGATTVREQLAAHRADPACAGCHRKIDPPGFALEAFDVTGAFRDRYRVSVKPGEGVDEKFNGKPVAYDLGPAVDASGEIEDGLAFADINEFRRGLEGRIDQIREHMLRQLIIYGTGAPVGPADADEYRAVLDRLSHDGGGVRSMIREIVHSEMFQTK